MTNNYTCIIIDDEPKAVELLTDSLNELYSNIEIKGTYTKWKDALEALRRTGIDIVFLDINMPQKNGIDLLTLVPDLKSEIIFVTAHPDHALEAFNFAASGYVLKPIKDTALTKAVDKAIERIKFKQLAENKLAKGVQLLEQKIGVPNNRGTDYVKLSDILYFEATKRYTKVVKKDGVLLSSHSIGKFKEMVEAYCFQQIHRSYIINLNYIERYENQGIVVMSNNDEIPLSKNFKDEFLNIFDKAK